MLRPRCSRVCLLAALVLTLLPSPAAAWTEAQVSSLRARVEVAPDARAHVRLELSVAVHGGWMTELEVAGLDPEIELDPAVPPVMTGSDGTTRNPRVELGTGRVAFRFRDRDAPRRGTYRIAFAYTTSLAERGTEPLRDGYVRFRWQLPGWRSGMDAVVVELVAPEGARLARADDQPHGITIETVEDGASVRFVHLRAHLPRTVPWTVAFDLPSDAVPVALRGAPRSGAAPPLLPTGRDGRPQKTPYLLAVVFAVVAILQRATFARACRARGAVPRPLIPLRHGIGHGLAVLGLAALAAHLWARLPIAAFAALVLVVLLAVQRTPRFVQPARLGSFRPATREDLVRARRASFVDALVPVAWTDAHGPVGFAVFAVLAGAFTRAHLAEGGDATHAVLTTWHALVLLFALFLCATRSHLPASPLAKLDALRRLASRMRLPLDDTGLAFRLTLHEDAHGRAQDARLRVVTEHRAPGLVRMDVALVERGGLGGLQHVPMWLLVVRLGSEADQRLVRALPGVHSRRAPGGRRARLLPFAARSLPVLRRMAEATETALDAPAPARERAPEVTPSLLARPSLLQ